MEKAQLVPTAAGPSPPHREDLAQDVLMYPNPRLTVHRAISAAAPAACAPPGPSPVTAPSSATTGCWGPGWAAPPPQLCPRVTSRGFYFLLLTSVRSEVEPVHEGKDERQHWSCSFSLNGRDSCSRWHELAYPTYMHLLASRQLRGTNQTSLFWFGGKNKPQTTISVYLSGSGIIH